MTTTPILGITLLEQAQAQKEITINEALMRLDMLGGSGVLDKDIATPPASPAAGDAYIVAASPTGLWAGKAGQIAYFDQYWRFVTPKEGMHLWVQDEDRMYVYHGSAWGILPCGTSADMLGVNATADSTNRFAVQAASASFSGVYTASGGNGDFQVKVNKETATDTASFLFQNNWSGRAELGLTGSDDFQLKTSANGSSWITALTADKTSGLVTCGNGASFGNVARAGTTILDWYEEGGFTPILYGVTTAGVGTYSMQSGQFTRIGNRVDFRIALAWSAHTGTGEGRISGLPYSNPNPAIPCVVFADGYSVGASRYLAPILEQSSNYIRLLDNAMAGGAAGAPSLDIAAFLLLQGTYFV